MTSSIRLCLVLHNHQPIGNFDGVFEQAYQDSYLPFLDVFERYPTLADRAAHQRLADGVARRAPSGVPRPPRARSCSRADRNRRRRVLRADPDDDSAARSRRADQHLHRRGSNNRLGAEVRGMWMPERVWEQSLTSDLAAAGIEVHGARRLPLQERRPRRRPTARLLRDRRRRPRAGGLPRQRAAAVHDSVRARRTQTIDYLGQHRRAAPGRGRRVRRRRREVRHLARHQEARLRRRLAAAVLRRAGRQQATGSTRPRSAKRSTACRRWARSICPTAAIAK